VYFYNPSNTTKENTLSCVRLHVIIYFFIYTSVNGCSHVIYKVPTVMTVKTAASQCVRSECIYAVLFFPKKMFRGTLTLTEEKYNFFSSNRKQ
jgi:hypothetical protein